ncbi:MAG: nicotinate phosphoribosyltransferase [Pyrinomonadaceae bacterium]
MSYSELPYRHNLTLFTDLYQLTMGQVYWATGAHEWEAVFHHSYRANPAGGGYTVACGLEFVLDYLRNLRFDDEDLAYLATIQGNDARPLFNRDYLKYLKTFEWTCDVDAVPEGTVMFPHEPLLRVRGPLLQAQLVETAILTLGNYATAVATKATRITTAAGDVPVYEFGARRASGIDGAFTATRSAYIGGFAGTSNVWAARHLRIPAQNIKGTMAHSLIMSFDTELEAFDAYAQSLPNNCVFLVDTYGTIEGVRHAIEIGKSLRARGFEMIGIRLDSGDLARLSKRARKMLDEAGFERAGIMATNDLDERLIQSLKAQEAAISVYGVGTKLMVPALAGVYKLSGIRKVGGEWAPKIKLSDQSIKTSIPGTLQVRRFRTDNGNVADCIYDERAGLPSNARMINLLDQTKQMRLPAGDSHDLLVPVMRGGRLVYSLPSLSEIRDYARRELHYVSDGTKRFDNPDEHRVGLEKSLYVNRERLILEHREASDWEAPGI